MNEKHLGDSYDLVKRFWQQLLAKKAPLYVILDSAKKEFIPKELEAKFIRLTKIEILPKSDIKLHSSFSMFNDPDTGIRMPDEKNQSESRTHITIKTIVTQLRTQKPLCVITYDQSHYRTHKSIRALEDQRKAKLDELSAEGHFAFYYVSHASFLFVFSTKEAREEIYGNYPDD